MKVEFTRIRVKYSSNLIKVSFTGENAPKTQKFIPFRIESTRCLGFYFNLFFFSTALFDEFNLVSPMVFGQTRRCQSATPSLWAQHIYFMKIPIKIECTRWFFAVKSIRYMLHEEKQFALQCSEYWKMQKPFKIWFCWKNLIMNAR